MRGFESRIQSRYPLYAVNTVLGGARIGLGGGVRHIARPGYGSAPASFLNRVLIIAPIGQHKARIPADYFLIGF